MSVGDLLFLVYVIGTVAFVAFSIWAGKQPYDGELVP